MVKRMQAPRRRADAAVYIMIFSDYGFKQETVELGSKVINDWGGIEELS